MKLKCLLGLHDFEYFKKDHFLNDGRKIAFTVRKCKRCKLKQIKSMPSCATIINWKKIK
jgi:hypothetical protein